MLPIVVVTELEAKRHHPELGYFARQALRLLDEFRVRHGRLDAPIPIGDLGGTVRVELNHSDPSVLPTGYRLGDNDSRILAVARNLQAEGFDVTVVSKDLPSGSSVSVGLASQPPRQYAPGADWRPTRPRIKGPTDGRYRRAKPGLLAGQPLVRARRPPASPSARPRSPRAAPHRQGGCAPPCTVGPDDSGGSGGERRGKRTDHVTSARVARPARRRTDAGRRAVGAAPRGSAAGRRRRRTGAPLRPRAAAPGPPGRRRVRARGARTRSPSSRGVTGGSRRQLAGGGAARAWGDEVVAGAGWRLLVLVGRVGADGIIAPYSW
ncbi:hypothetical protein STENM327S_06733 [Streptomyces tendae]